MADRRGRQRRRHRGAVASAGSFHSCRSLPSANEARHPLRAPPTVGARQLAASTAAVQVPQGAFCVSSVLFPAAILGGGRLSAASKSWWKHTEHLVYNSPIGRRARTSSKCVALNLPRLLGSLGQARSRNLHRSKRRGPSQHHCRRASQGCPCFHVCLHDSPQIFFSYHPHFPVAQTPPHEMDGARRLIMSLAHRTHGL